MKIRLGSVLDYTTLQEIKESLIKFQDDTELRKVENLIRLCDDFLFLESKGNKHFFHQVRVNIWNSWLDRYIALHRVLYEITKEVQLITLRSNLLVRQNTYLAGDIKFAYEITFVVRKTFRSALSIFFQPPSRHTFYDRRIILSHEGGRNIFRWIHNLIKDRSLQKISRSE